MSDESIADRVEALLAERGQAVERGITFEDLVGRMLRRVPKHLVDADGDALAEWVATEFSERIFPNRYYPLIRQVREERDDDAFRELMGILDREAHLRGLLYGKGFDPEQELPKLWSKIWEAIPKWDGRDFRAYVARIVRNYCHDEYKRRKRAPGMIPGVPVDRRPAAATEDRVAERDAINCIVAEVRGLERRGELSVTDATIHGLIATGRSTREIVEIFSSPLPAALAAAAAALAAAPLEGSQALALRFLLDGVDVARVAELTKIPGTAVGAAARALADLSCPADVAQALCREGCTSESFLGFQSLSVNAVNLRINRSRLRIWMALCESAYETLRRRNRIDDRELLIVQHRCAVEPRPWCRMYKGSGCRREAKLEEIAGRCGFDCSPDQLRRWMDEFRAKVMEELGGFPDYDSCLNERKAAGGRKK